MSGAVQHKEDQFIPPPPGEILGHPKALWMLFGAEFWERFAYYGMRAILAVYVATTFFGPLPEGEANAQAAGSSPIVTSATNDRSCLAVS